VDGSRVGKRGLRHRQFQELNTETITIQPRLSHHATSQYTPPTNCNQAQASKMGAAISLPLLSFFALPAFTSYGTSMNLLFFTLNWYILLLTHPPLQVEIIGISLVQFLLYLLPGLLFLGLDAGVPSLAAAVKTQGDLSLPIRGGKGARKRVAKIVGWSIFNVALGVALLGGLETLLTKVLLTRHALSLSKTMPMPYAILKSVALLLAIRGVSFKQHV
jgi:hypothetical protein